MADGGAVSLKIDDKIVQRALEIEMKSAVARAFDSQGIIVAEIARRIVSQKVDETGKECTYTRSDSITFLDWMLKRVVKEACEASIKDAMKEHAAEIAVQIRKEIGSVKGQKSIAQAVVSGLARSVDVSWNHRLDVSFQTKDR